MINPRKIVEIEAGYMYQLPFYQVTDNALIEHCQSNFQFCRGDMTDPSKIRHAGYFVETLLEACRQRLIAVNVGDLATQESADAILSIESAIESLESRSRNRKLRQVQGTYQK